MRIHWFSPLPPDPTDIGHFSGRVLRELAARAEVVVWTGTADPARDGLAGIEMRRFDPDRPDFAALSRGCIVYNLGNHGLFHAGIHEMSQILPGVLILHEADLQGLFLHMWIDRDGDPDRYVSYLDRTYGALGAWFARARLDGLPLDRFAHRYPIVAPALRGALGVICHTAQAQAAATRPDLPVLRLELPFPARPLTRPARREGPIRLVQFGYLGPHRELDAILAALSRWRGPAVRFEIYGRLWDEAHIRCRIEACGLRDVVRIMGFVEEAALDEAVSRADLVFNLRNPTLGEASGTQMRIWANAAPSLVTDHGWFAELPGDAVAKIPPGREAAEIGRALDRLAADRHCFDPLGLRGRDILLQRHAPSAYADALLPFLAANGGLARCRGK